MVQLFSSFETSCAHKVNSPGPEDTFPMDCESILCPNVRKTAYISSVHSSHEFTFTSFHDIPALLSALNRFLPFRFLLIFQFIFHPAFPSFHLKPCHAQTSHHHRGSSSIYYPAKNVSLLYFDTMFCSEIPVTKS